MSDLKDEMKDLESKLMEFKGVGPVTVNRFLRELRGIREKAQPLPGDPVIIAARCLDLTVLEGKDNRFSDFEAFC